MDEQRSTTTGEQQLTPLLLAVLGSVCGTLVADALNTTPQRHLLAAAVGAGIPPLVAVVGPYTRLRAAAGVLMAAAALVVTYGGFTLSEVAGDSSERTFPVPAALADQGSTSSAAASPSPSAAAEREELCRGEQCVAWAPATLRCSASSCDGPVRVSSTGTAAVGLREIHFHDDAEGAFERGGTCSPELVLQPGDECEIEVVPIDSAATGRLEVHQDLPGPSSVVRIVRTTGGSGGQGVELALEGPVTCGAIDVGAGADGGDSLTLSATVRDNDAPDRPDSVPVRLAGEGGIEAEATTALDTSTPVAVEITLLPEHYGRQLALTMTVDPADEVPDEDEADNVLRVTVALPQAPGADQVQCSSSS